MLSRKDELTRRFLSVLDGTALTESTEVAEALADSALRPLAPERGDDVEAWIKRERDKHDRYGDGTPDWMWCALDNLLDNYREHADTGTPLGVEVDGPKGPGEQ